MKPEDKALLSLVANSLEKAKDDAVPDDIDWEEVLRLAYAHKVSMLVTECDDERFVRGYKYHVSVVETLCGFFRSHGLTPIVLKGLSAAEDYPVPMRRGIGDLDIYLIDRNGCCAAKEGDRLLREIAIEERDDIDGKDGEMLYHSSFMFRKVSVENHHVLINRRYHGKTFERAREQLEKMMADRFSDGEKNAWSVPPPNANAVFLMWHLYKHFVWPASFCTLRQFTDWMQFLRKHHNEVDWQSIEWMWMECGISRFARGVNGFVVRYLGCEPEICRDYYRDERVMECYAKRIFEPVIGKDSAVKRLLWFHRNKECIEYIYQKNWWVVMVNYIYEIIRFYKFRIFSIKHII